MKYTNNKIEQLIAERNAAIEKYNREIQNEIDKEKAKYKFSWKRFLIMIGTVVLMLIGVEAKKKIFPKTSIWSWGYYCTIARFIVPDRNLLATRPLLWGRS